MVLVARDRSRLDLLREKIAKSTSAVMVRTVTGDLTEASVQHEVFDAAKALPGGPDLLINGAGINEFHTFESQASVTIERLLTVNLLVPIQLTQLLLPLLENDPALDSVRFLGRLGYPGFAVTCDRVGLRDFPGAAARTVRQQRRGTLLRATRHPHDSHHSGDHRHESRARHEGRCARARRPQAAAVHFPHQLGRKLGFPERLYVFLNHLMPGVNDKAIRGKLKIIRKHLERGEPSPARHRRSDMKALRFYSRRFSRWPRAPGPVWTKTWRSCGRSGSTSSIKLRRRSRKPRSRSSQRAPRSSWLISQAI